MRSLANVFWPLVIFILVAAVFFWPVFLKGQVPFSGDLLVGEYEPYKSNSYFGWSPGAVPHKAQGPDVIRQLYPWKFLAIQSIKDGELPWWNPYNFSGNPQLANFQTAVFYPLNFIFFLFPFNLSWTIFILLQPILAGFFTYLFTKELGLKRIAAIFSGITFAFSSYLIVWLEYGNIIHAVLWLPLALYFVERLIKNFCWKNGLLLSLTLALSILAGYIQVSIYLFGVVFFYFLYRFSKVKKKKLSNTLFFLAILIAPFIVCLPQILATLEFFQFSARSAYLKGDLPSLLSPAYHFITIFVPDFFGNPATRNYWLNGTYIERVAYFGVLAPLLIALAFLSKKGKPFWFFVGLAAVTYSLAVNLPPTLLILGLNPPLISTAVPTRIFYLFCFSSAILAGIGLDFWLKERMGQKVKRIAIAFVFFYLLIWLFVFLAPKFFPQESWVNYLGISKRNLILPTFLVFTSAGLLLTGEFFWQKKKVVSLFLVALTIFDLFYFFQKITPFTPQEFIYPKTPVIEFLRQKGGINRFWGYGTAGIDSNFASFEKVFSTEGYDALYLKRYGEFLATSRDGKIPSKIARSDANIAPGYGAEDLRNNHFRQRILNLLGVKYILNKNELLQEKWEPDTQTFPPEIYSLIWQEGKWQIYENKEALPRIFLAGNYLVESEKEKIIQKIFSPDFNPRTLILEEKLPVEVFTSGKGEVELKTYTPNKITIAAKVGDPQLLFLSDNYYPGWKAFINGQEVKIYRAHYSFRAVIIPEGQNEVVFVYKPSFLWQN